MKKILIFTAHFHPYKGGLENFTLDLGKRLSKKNIEVDVFTFNLNKNKDIEKYEGMTIYRFPSWSIMGKTFTFPKFNSKYKKQLIKIMSKQYDVIFTNTRFFTTSWLGMVYSEKLKKKNSKTKFIHIEHGNVHVIHNNPLITAFAWIYDQTVGRMIFHEADLVVGISKPCSNFAKKLGAKKTKTIHNSIETKKFRKVKTNLRKKLGIPEKNLVVINGIGRLIYAKGLHDTIKELKDFENVTIITIGSGPYEKSLKKLAEELDVHAVFPGTLSQKEIVEYLSIGDIFINPSYSEGLPTCVLEAGAIGLPVIATDVGGTKDIITSKESGILIKPNKKGEIRRSVNRLLDKETRNKLGKNIQKHIKENYDWKININKFRGLI